MVLYVVTPEREVVNVDIDSVILPGESGQLEILPEHTHLLSVLSPGVVLYKDSHSKKDKAVSIGGGISEIRDNLVRIVVTIAENSDEIDVERAKKAVQKAENLLLQEDVIANEKEFAKVESALKRALARLEAAKYQ